MSVFAAALGTIFRDPNMSAAASYFSKRSGARKDLRVIRKRADQDVGFNGASFVADSDLLDVQMTDCPDLAAGDLFTIRQPGLPEEVLEVVGEPARDVLRCLWTATVRAF